MEIYKNNMNIIIAFLAIVIFVFECVVFWPYTMDDSFISFRYSKHIAEGFGPIWNLADADHPVEGYTSILHVFLLAGINKVFGISILTAGKAIGILGVGGLAAVLAVWARCTRTCWPEWGVGAGSEPRTSPSAATSS